MIFFGGCSVMANHVEKNITDDDTVFCYVDISELQRQAEQEGWSFTIGENSATSRPFSQLCGLIEPEDWESGGRFAGLIPSEGLPQKYDWREKNGCTGIRDQGQCGSCWAFATVAPLESAIKIEDGYNVDLSEQWLVSCNTYGYSCAHGGWFVHELHKGTLDECGRTGAVLENDYPYTASDSSCKCNDDYSHVYVIEDWAYVGRRNNVPSVDAIKQGIYDHGPVACCVAVDNAFTAYNGGVFNKDNPGRINHAVALVGWDDTKGSNGVWILRNSWGTDWGIDGYMYIEYGCSNVGYAANYITGYSEISGEDEHVTVSVYKITNLGQYDLDDIDTIADLRGGVKPEWFYRVGLKTGSSQEYVYHENRHSFEGEEGFWIWDWKSAHTWTPNQGHLFKAETPEVEVTLKLMDDDVTSDDLADVSGYNNPDNNGYNDDIPDKRAAIFHGTYSLISNSLKSYDSGNPIKYDYWEKDGNYYITRGDFKPDSSTGGESLLDPSTWAQNDAKIWFKLTDSYDAGQYEPDMSVTPDALDFGSRDKGTHTSSFQVKNIGTHDPHDWAEHVEWTASDDKGWISLSSTSGSVRGGSYDTVTVSINTNSLDYGKSYSGKITVSYGNDKEYVNVKVKVARKTKTVDFSSFLGFFRLVKTRVPFLLYYIQDMLEYSIN